MEQTPNKQFDIRDLSKYSTGTLLAGAAGIAFFIYLLPVITATVWTGVKLIAGLCTAGAMIGLLTSKKFWRFLRIFNEKLAKILTFWIIEWDEFILQEMEIDQAEKDREKIKKEASRLYGEVNTKDEELGKAIAEMKENSGLIKELQKEGRSNEDSELQLYASNLSRSKEFIETIQPLRDQIFSLANTLDKVYKETDIKIRDARAELAIQKTKLASLTSGETAMNSALSIFKSDNADVLLAKDVVRRKIGEKIGSIRTTLDIINPIMDQRALSNKVKVNSVLEQMKTLDITSYQLSDPVLKQKENQYSKLLNK